MEEWNYKIKDDLKFKNELKRLSLKFGDIQLNRPKGQEMIIFRLRKISRIVLEKEPFESIQKSFGNLLPFLEFAGGKEFLETQDGKDIIEVFFYFAYKWNKC